MDYLKWSSDKIMYIFLFRSLSIKKINYNNEYKNDITFYKKQYIIKEDILYFVRI